MDLITFSDNDKKEYNRFLINSKYKDILQSWEWGEVKSKFNWEAQRIGFLKNGDIIGVAQLLKRRLPLGFSLFYIPRGPVFDWEDLGLAKEVIDSLSQRLAKSTKDQRTLFLRLEPPAEESKGLTQALKESGFKPYFKTVQPPSTLLIDLAPSENELFRNFRRTARNLIYRSEREGLIVNVIDASGVTQNDLRSFYNLYRLTGKRFSFPLRPLKQFEFLLKEMAQSRAFRFYVARIKGAVLAYGIILLLGDRAAYIWGGTGRHKEYSKFFNYGYIWGMLKDLKKLGVKTFDFWGLGPKDDKNHPWQGFSRFKTSFGGRRFDYVGAFDLPISRFYPFFKILDKIVTPKYRATSS